MKVCNYKKVLYSWIKIDKSNSEIIFWTKIENIKFFEKSSGNKAIIILEYESDNPKRQFEK